MLIFIVGLALTLRLISLFGAGSFWFDEVFTYHFAAMPLARAWQYLQFENNPPLHFFIAHWLIALFGDHEFWLRFSSTVFSILTIPLLYLIGKKIHSRQAGLLAAALFAVSTFSIFYATEFRMYPLLILETTASIYLFLRYLEEAKKIPLALVIINTLALLTHLTAALLLILEAVYLFWRHRAIFWRFFVWQAALGLIYFSWFLPFILPKAASNIANAWYFSVSFDPWFIFNLLFSFLVYIDLNAISSLIPIFFGALFLFILALAFGAPLYIKEERRVTCRAEKPIIASDFLFLLLSIPIILGFLLNAQIPKQYSISFPAFLLLFSIGILNIKQKFKLQSSYLILLLFAILVAGIGTIIRIPYSLDRVAETIEMQERNKEAIFAAAHMYTLPLEKYYRGQLPIIPIYMGPDAFDDDLRIVKHNWHINYYSKEELNRFLAKETAPYRKIYVLGKTKWQNEGDIVKQWFLANGWRLEREYFWDGFANEDLHVFKKIIK